MRPKLNSTARLLSAFILGAFAAVAIPAWASCEVSAVMQAFTASTSIQQALNLLVPAVASTKGALLIGDGTNAAPSVPLADGNILIGDHTQPQGVNQVTLPTPDVPFVEPATIVNGNQVNMTWAQPRIAIAPGFGVQAVYLPDTSTIPPGNATVEVFNDTGASLNIGVLNGAAQTVYTIQPGTCARMSFVQGNGMGPNGTWFQS